MKHASCTNRQGRRVEAAGHRRLFFFSLSLARGEILVFHFKLTCANLTVLCLPHSSLPNTKIRVNRPSIFGNRNTSFARCRGQTFLFLQQWLDIRGVFLHTCVFWNKTLKWPLKSFWKGARIGQLHRKNLQIDSIDFLTEN